MLKKGVLASIITVLTMGGLAYGISSFTSETKTCPLEGTPACPKVAAAKAAVISHDKTVTRAELPPCCQKK